MGRKHLTYDRRQYVLNQAKTVMGQLNIRSAEFEQCSSAMQIARALPFEDITHILKYRHTPSTLGKLADCGVGSDKDGVEAGDLFRNFSGAGVSMVELMGDEGWLHEHDYGCVSLLTLASAALTCAMADMIWIDCLQSQRTSTQTGRPQQT